MKKHLILILLTTLFLMACASSAGPAPSATPDAWVDMEGEPVLDEGTSDEDGADAPQGEASRAAYYKHRLYLMRPDGSEVMPLTPEGGEDFAGAWSPDGSQIAFWSRRAENIDLYLIRADGSELRRLTEDPGHDTSAVWSPDGQRIAWVRTQNEPVYRQDIMVMNADGSDVRQLTTTHDENSLHAWSPDGTQIAWSAFTNEGTDVYVADADGGNLRQLTDHVGYDEYPTWSPDGAQIFFWSDRVGNGDIFVMNADGSEVRNLSDHPAIEGWFALSPDGTRIAFTSNREASHPDLHNIFVMNADGSDPVQLTSDPYGGTFPTWSPDGRQIAFTSYRDDEALAIFVMDADGTNEMRLTAEPQYSHSGPLWSPDGEWIVFSRSEPAPLPEQDALPGDVEETRDEAAIYSAVIRRIYTQDDTFGGELQPSTLFILTQTDDTIGDPTSMDRASHPVPEAVQRDIKVGLAELPAEIVWIGHRDEAPRDAYDVVENGAVITLGNIHRQEEGSVHVAGGIYVGFGGVGGQTYVLEEVDGVWTIMGTMGPVWVS